MNEHGVMKWLGCFPKTDSEMRRPSVHWLRAPLFRKKIVDDFATSRMSEQKLANQEPFLVEKLVRSVGGTDRRYDQVISAFHARLSFVRCGVAR